MEFRISNLNSTRANKFHLVLISFLGTVHETTTTASTSTTTTTTTPTTTALTATPTDVGVSATAATTTTTTTTTTTATTVTSSPGGEGLDRPIEAANVSDLIYIIKSQ